MNIGIPTLPPNIYDPSKREWVWGSFAGIRKNKLFKNVNGTAMVMARLFNPDRKSPYANVLNARFAFEFPMKRNRRRNEPPSILQTLLVTHG